MRFRMLRSAVLLTVTLLLAGCMTPQPVVTVPPEPEVSPIFATDEEALAAATEAYAKYLEVADRVFANGGEGVEALSSVLTGNQLRVEVEGLANVAKNGWHSVGSTKFDPLSLQQYNKTSQGESIVIAYVCEDISETDVLDASGVSVRSEELANRSLYEISFDFEPETSSLAVSNRELWESGKC